MVKFQILDLLVLPLLSRKLIADTYLDERQNNTFINAVAFLIAIPIEITRLSLGITLTLCLIPIIVIVNLVKACFSELEQDIADNINGLNQLEWYKTAFKNRS